MNNPFDFSQFFPKYDAQDMMRQMQSAFTGFSAPQAPKFDMSSLTDAQRKNLEALVESNTRAIACTQQLMQKQAELFQKALQSASEASTEVAQLASDPQEAAKKQSEMMQKAMEQAIKSSQEISEMVTKAQEEVTEIVTRRVNEGMEEIKKVVGS